jgi:hypothetical protein
MLIYTQPGNCSECGKKLVESTTQIPGQEAFSVYICSECATAHGGIDVGRMMLQHDRLWMFKEFPKDHSTWECCVKEFKKTKRRADLWDDLKHVLENGTWSGPGAIEAVLTNMAYMESEST